MCHSVLLVCILTEDHTAYLPPKADEELSNTLESVEADTEALLEDETPNKQEESKQQPKQPDNHMSSESGPDEIVDSEVNSEAIADVSSRNAGTPKV